MKKTTLIAALSIAFAIGAQAAPADRTVRTVTQPDGTQMHIYMVGDENLSFTVNAATGEYVTLDETTGFWRPMTDEELSEANTMKAQKLSAVRSAEQVMISGTPYSGHILVPVVLVQFADLSYTPDDSLLQYYDTIFNMVDTTRYAYTSNNDGKDYFTSGLRQYFRDQSLGLFDPEFDILGPITVSKGYAYYGANSGSSKDVNYTEMVKEVFDSLCARGCMNDAAKYDADGNGKIDLICFQFAGQSENSTYKTDQIWSKNSKRSLTAPDGTLTDNIVLTPELSGAGNRGTIGIIAHEISHALGLPDFYSTKSGSTALKCYGMDAWSLMDQGEYNGMEFIPAPYTLHERLMMGWSQEPDSVPTTGKVTLEPISRNGKGLILRNPDNENEYITIENHQPESVWEMVWGNSAYVTYQKNRGLLVTHVDYNKSIWSSNTVNNDSAHQRCSPLAADGVRIPYGDVGTTIVGDENETIQITANYFYKNLLNDIFSPANGIKTLNNSNPLSIWFTGDSIGIDITDIKHLADGCIEITFGHPADSIPLDTIPSDSIPNDSIPSDSVPDAIETIALETSADIEKRPKIVMLKNGRIIVGGHDLYGRKSETTDIE